MRCPQCNSKLTKKNKFCPECGAVVVWDDNDTLREEGRRNKIIIIVLSILLLAALVMVGVLFALGNSGAEEPSNTTEVTQEKISFCDDPIAISEAAQSVVKLNCYNSGGNIVATGSGFAAFEKGVIITNYHVIEDMPTRIEIVMESGEKCDIFGGIGASIERDVAILYYQHRSADFDLPILPISSPKTLHKGEKVVAIGSPLGLTNVVSTGVFSGYTNANGVTDIQFTASISNGSSGGALFDNNGEVIGVTYASFEEGQNLNLAVPIEFVESIWKAESKDRTTLNNFYDLLIPHYTVEYVLQNYRSLKNTVFYLDFWPSSYGKTTDNIVGFCANSYEEIYDPAQNVLEKRFQADMERYSKSSLLKAVKHSAGYWNDIMMDIEFERDGKMKSVKCSGTGWSQNDQKPYVIIE